MYNMQLYCSACSRQNSLLLYAEDDPLFRGTFRTCSNCSTWWIECIIILPSFSYIDGLTPCFGDPCRHKRFCIVVFSFNLSFRYLNETLHQPFRFLFSPCGINILSSVSRYLSSPLPWYFISFNVHFHSRTAIKLVLAKTGSFMLAVTKLSQQKLRRNYSHMMYFLIPLAFK